MFECALHYQTIEWKTITPLTGKMLEVKDINSATKSTRSTSVPQTAPIVVAVARSKCYKMPKHDECLVLHEGKNMIQPSERGSRQPILQCKFWMRTSVACKVLLGNIQCLSLCETYLSLTLLRPAFILRTLKMAVWCCVTVDIGDMISQNRSPSISQIWAGWRQDPKKTAQVGNVLNLQYLI